MTDGSRKLDTEELGAVRSVPLIGADRWHEPERSVIQRPRELPLAQSIAAATVPFERIDGAPRDGLLEQINTARVMLVGEASHGTSEFYAMRPRITEELSTQKSVRALVQEHEWRTNEALERLSCMRTQRIGPTDKRYLVDRRLRSRALALALSGAPERCYLDEEECVVSQERVLGRVPGELRGKDGRDAAPSSVMSARHARSARRPWLEGNSKRTLGQC